MALIGLFPSFATSTEYWKNVLSRERTPDACSGTLGSLEPLPEGESLSAFILESTESAGPIFSHLYLRIATPGGISSFWGVWPKAIAFASAIRNRANIFIAFLLHAALSRGYRRGRF